jgi:RNA polymerase sigma-54 factor
MLKQNILQKPNLRINQKINASIINSIKILQMSANELTKYTQIEIEKNPFLISPKPHSVTINVQGIDNYKKNKSLKEWLYEQSSFISTSIWGEKLVEVFIENLDSSGFCQISSKEASYITGASLSQSDAVLKKLKLLDPEGIFSNSIEEHLTFQLKKKNIFNDNYNIILNNLQDVASGNYNKLSKLCTLKESEIIEMINNIKLLRPRPLDGIEDEIIKNIIPDIIIEVVKEKINCVLNNTDSYKVLIDKKYINEIKLKQKNINTQKTRDYIKDCIAHGKMLQNHLNRRNNTLLLVSKNILNYQKKFFLIGEEGILPLTHKIISKKILMNESTVSRAVKNKYIKFNNMTLPLSYFFSSKTTDKNNSNNNSRTAIKAKIKKILATEKNTEITHSDNNIVKILKKENIIISRRTVSKYRETLNIPNSLVRSKNNL